ncbi:vWA domain-containing protein [Pseudoxanthomonas sp. JBR18]|uniref:vWA domain-containing protein n=1 Tax=Pseudoxanthomonas sp. JBR18 TaxID=2969308 RepID=UPI0023050934|nr:vWA domain-containing protein [Pseudoxanthomonas sp. JBR18]WCE04917.1 VWA domain-containing protein [Pseudoxanthomonas sp. JBR18]
MGIDGIMFRIGGNRDPIAGSKLNTSPADAGVSFSLNLITGGAKKIENKTTVEARHWLECGTQLPGSATYDHVWPGKTKTLVVDDTGSMQNEIDAIKIAIESSLTEESTLNYDREFAYSLLTFKDNVTTRSPISTDVSPLLAALNAITPSGGGECPESSGEALLTALDQLEADEDRAGSILLVTDASPTNDLRSQIKQKANALNIPITVLLTGDCAATSTSIGVMSINGASDPNLVQNAVSAQDFFSDIAESTGGVYKYSPNGTVDDYVAFIGDRFEADSIDSQDLPVGITTIKGAAGSSNLYEIAVPENVNQLRIREWASGGQVAIYLSREQIPTALGSDWAASANGTTSPKSIGVSHPVAGTYYLKVQGITDYANKALQVDFGP